jgi:uncharacterized protein YbjT (DUF2867 family)
MEAILLGASGLIGRELLTLLLADQRYTVIHLPLRKKLDIDHPKIKIHLIDFDRAVETFRPGKVDELFIAFGTTIKQAGSQENFEKIDKGYPLAIAGIAIKAGCRRCFIVSAVGASSHSKIFYSRIKGETEDALIGMAFDDLHIFGPSLLLGDRKESRPLEAFSIFIMKGITRLKHNLFGQYSAVYAHDVARAMLKSAKMANKHSVQVYHYNEIYRLAKQTTYVDHK